MKQVQEQARLLQMSFQFRVSAFAHELLHWSVDSVCFIIGLERSAEPMRIAVCFQPKL